MPSNPWSKRGADIFDLGSQKFLIMVDYWSNYFEVQELKQSTSASVIHAFKVLVTDNGTQFSSSEFRGFKYKTSSPQYPLSKFANPLMGRRTQTLLPTHSKLLQPKVDHQTRDKLAKRKAIQKAHYNKKSRLLMLLQPDQAIRTKWSCGSCVKTLLNPSYEVELAGHCHCRNRCQLKTYG